MRLTVDLIDGAVTDDESKKVAYLLLAEQIAGQAVALAAFRNGNINELTADRWITAVTGYPGVTMRRIPGTNYTIGERAIERLHSLLHAQTD